MMKTLILLLIAFALSGQFIESRNANIREYRNANIYNGKGFQPGTFYTVEDKFFLKKPDHGSASSVIDLKSQFVIPPFAEAHNHNLTSDDQAAEMIPKYLKEGVFYAKMQSSMPLLTGEILHRFNRPESVDVVFANGPLTASGGHPVALRERLLESGLYPPGFTKETLNNQGYVLIDNDSDLEKKWPVILGFRPDFIKAILVYSEEFEERKNDPAYFGQKGMNPQLLPKLVTKAHAHGLRVSVHVNTATDFHHAVSAGVDEIAHLPGYREPTYIRPEDARLAVEKDIVVVTTTCLALKRKEQNDYEKIRAAQIANLRLLHQSGVKIAIGSDDFEQTSIGEAEYLKELNVFDHRTLLQLWTENTVKTIFPHRKVGALRDGYEASFLVLSGNPLDDWGNTKRIVMRVKQGVVLP